MLSRRDILFNTDYNDDDDEEKLYERQALIANEDDVDDDADLTSKSNSVRHRQQSATSANYEMKRFKSRDLPSESVLEFTFYEIQPGDSLQSICLRYTCSVNQVKRLNGIMTDQEFYGLRRLKLPLGRLGLLEDMLNQQKTNTLGETSENLSHNNGDTKNPFKPVNSPGSALSVSVKHPRFKPLLSPVYSSDRVNELSNVMDHQQMKHRHSNDSLSRIQRNSHSFSSLDGSDDVQSNNPLSNFAPNSRPVTSHNYVDTKLLHQENFIKPDIDRKHISIDDMLLGDEVVVKGVFEDLDYQVERAKAVAETYGQRAADLVDKIGINCPTPSTSSSSPNTSKMPENFGLNLKRLIFLMIVICIIAPLLLLA